MKNVNIGRITTILNSTIIENKTIEKIEKLTKKAIKKRSIKVDKFIDKRIIYNCKRKKCRVAFNSV